MNAEDLAAALQLRRVGRNRWRGPCPRCGGKTRFQVTESRDGHPLVWCFGGCQFRDIASVLVDLGLWPRPLERTPAERRDYGRRRCEAEHLADEVRWWRAALVWDLEHDHAAALEAQDWFVWAQLGRDIYRARRASGADLVRRYQTASQADPDGTAELVAIGRDDEAHALAITAVIIAFLARTQEVKLAA